MPNSTLFLAAAIAALSLTSAASAAPASVFDGTRADVRSFCVGADHTLLEGGNYSLCLTPVTDVVCRDDDVCASSNLDLALAAGFQRLTVATAGQPQ
jgi:hypothetical protein